MKTRKEDRHGSAEGRAGTGLRIPRHAAGHFLMLEQPDEFNRRLRALLEEFGGDED